MLEVSLGNSSGGKVCATDARVGLKVQGGVWIPLRYAVRLLVSFLVFFLWKAEL